MPRPTGEEEGGPTRVQSTQQKGNARNAPEAYAVTPAGQILPADQYDPLARHILVQPPAAEAA